MRASILVTVLRQFPFRSLQASLMSAVRPIRSECVSISDDILLGGCVHQRPDTEDIYSGTYECYTPSLDWVIGDE